MCQNERRLLQKPRNQTEKEAPRVCCLSAEEKSLELGKMKTYRESNKDKVAAQKHKHYDENRDTILDAKHRWYQANKEEVNERRKEKYSNIAPSEKVETLALRRNEYANMPEEKKHELSEQWHEDYIDNKAAKLEYQRRYESLNHTTICQRRRERYKDDREPYLRRQNQRRRNLPTSLILNDWFEDSNLHHMTPDVAIFIPSKLHRAINHNLKTGWNMDKINKAVEDWVRWARIFPSSLLL